jgi:hypothetical protein
MCKFLYRNVQTHHGKTTLLKDGKMLPMRIVLSQISCLRSKEGYLDILKSHKILFIGCLSLVIHFFHSILKPLFSLDLCFKAGKFLFPNFYLMV